MSFATRHKVLSVFMLLILVYVLLLIPDSSVPVPPASPSRMNRPFIWNQDARWDALEASYAQVRSAGGEAARQDLEARLRMVEESIRKIGETPLPPAAPEFSRLEEQFFAVAPLVGAYPRYTAAYVALSSRMRAALKRESENWDMSDRAARETLYRIVYGGRTAVEEVILQAPPEFRPPSLQVETDEPSAAPSAELLGVKIHSGDILVSRGAVPTSSLIARGNDFPGNFSHIALAYVDPAAGRLLLIESHIEKGVAVSSAAQYMGDKKLRVLVLRLRSDLPALQRDPLLAHHAASAMLRRVREKHIPYDFSMDYSDSTKLFCSEIASIAYRDCGVKLWMGMSHMSGPGLRSWLADFGVRHWETQEPTDLEYDPQLRVVAEWRDPETLRKDHMDNAVTEAMLERAESGERLQYARYLLPPARVVKALSSALNLFGFIGPIPEGMSATSALKHKAFVARHERAAAAVRSSAEQFRRERGYEAPYWALVRMARNVL